MSSIYGVFSNQQPTKPCIERMMTAANYWSPEDEAYWTSDQNHIALGKSLLKNCNHNEDLVVGLNSSKNDNLRIVANVRLDNRIDLINTLYTTENNLTYSDSDIILAAYRHWGKHCVNHIQGDFVFIIWDEYAKHFFCARDHFGVKVLFYSMQESGLMLTNEHSAFFTSGWSNSCDYEENKVIANLWSVNPTKFTSPNPDINILPPAHTLEFNIAKGELKIERYWKLKPNREYENLDHDKLLFEFKKQFTQAVTRRLDTNYKIGTELSEGLDSNSIAGVAATQLTPKKLFTFSHDCIRPNQTNDIWKQVYKDIYDMQALHDNLSPVWVEQTNETKFEINSEFKIKFYEAFGGVVPLYGERFKRAKLAQDRNIRVILSGWGGDQCATSSAPNYNDELLRDLRIIQLYKNLRQQHRNRSASHPLNSLLKLSVKNLYPSLYNRLKLMRKRGLHIKAKKHFLRDQFIRELKLNPYTKFTLTGPLFFSTRDKEYYDLFAKGLTKNLIEAELSAKRFKVEYRFPMLDKDLVELAFSMPSHLKQYQGIERYPIRHLLEGLTTKRIQWRKKSDVTSPLAFRIREMKLYAPILKSELRQCKFADVYSSTEKLNTSLNSLDPFTIRQLQYLAHLCKFYQPK